MKLRVAIALLTATLPGIVLAQGAVSYQCSMGDEVRRVEILAEPGASVPCEVHYYKDKNAPDEKQVLWRATSEAGYCEARTEEFIGNLEGWGWDCGRGDASMPGSDIDTEMEAEIEDEAAADIEAEAEEAADDTDDLMPATN